MKHSVYFLLLLMFLRNQGILGEPKTLHYISDLDSYCVENICRGLRFPSLTQQVIFNSSVSFNASELIFKNSDFRNFPHGLFKSMKIIVLEMPYLSIETIARQSFFQADDLKFFFVAFNNIEEIPDSAFEGAHSLHSLYLQQNRISKLSTESFKGLNHLLKLDLDNNLIEDLPDGIFASVPLIELRLRNNRLKHLGEKTFEALQAIEFIHLSGNDIEEIDSHSFRNVRQTGGIDISENPKLKSLDLIIDCETIFASDCNLGKVHINGSVKYLTLNNNSLRSDELHVKDCLRLEELNLSSNRLDNVDFLKHFPNLKVLLISNNPSIKSLNTDFSLRHLEIFLAQNIGLTFLNGKFLTESQNLMQLDISSNHLQVADPSYFLHLNNLEKIIFDKNPWSCESLQRLMDEIIKPRSIYYPKNYDIDGDHINFIACLNDNETSTTTASTHEIENESNEPNLLMEGLFLIFLIVILSCFIVYYKRPWPNTFRYKQFNV